MLSAIVMHECRDMLYSRQIHEMWKDTLQDPTDSRSLMSHNTQLYIMTRILSLGKVLSLLNRDSILFLIDS